MTRGTSSLQFGVFQSDLGLFIYRSVQAGFSPSQFLWIKDFIKANNHVVSSWPQTCKHAVVLKKGEHHACSMTQQGCVIKNDALCRCPWSLLKVRRWLEGVALLSSLAHRSPWPPTSPATFFPSQVGLSFPLLPNISGMNPTQLTDDPHQRFCCHYWWLSGIEEKNETLVLFLLMLAKIQLPSDPCPPAHTWKGQNCKAHSLLLFAC